jgi:hypothetical protein
LVTVLSFYAFRTRRWLAGGFAGALATATRVNGILMLPALAWIAYRSAEPTPRDRAAALVGLLLVPVGVLAYSLYVYSLSGNPLEWAASIERWGYHVRSAPWDAPVRLLGQLVRQPYTYLITDGMAPYDVLYGGTAIAFVLITPFVWRDLGAAYGMFLLLNLCVPLSSGTFGIGALLFGPVPRVHLAGVLRRGCPPPCFPSCSRSSYAGPRALYHAPPLF